MSRAADDYDAIERRRREIFGEPVRLMCERCGDAGWVPYASPWTAGSAHVPCPACGNPLQKDMP